MIYGVFKFCKFFSTFKDAPFGLVCFLASFQVSDCLTLFLDIVSSVFLVLERQHTHVYRSLSFIKSENLKSVTY